MSAALRLKMAALDAAERLMECVGLPLNPVDRNGERLPVNGSIVCRDEIPEAAWLAVCAALDMLAIAAEILGPESEPLTTVEEGLAMMMEGRGDA